MGRRGWGLERFTSPLAGEVGGEAAGWGFGLPGGDGGSGPQEPEANRG